MGFRISSYCTVWAVENKGNFTKVRISITRKDRTTNEYVQDFGGYVMFIGPAHAKAQQLKPKDRIRLLEVDVSNRFDKALNREFTDFKCFDFEMADQPGARPTQAPDSNPVEGDEEPPF